MRTVSSTVVVIVSIVTVSFIAVLALRAHHRSRAAYFRTWATSRGWTYTELDPSLAKRYTWGPFRSWGAYVHVIRGKHRTRNFTAFEHGYGEPSAGPPLPHSYRVVAVAIPDAGDHELPRPLRSPARVSGELVAWEEKALTTEALQRMLDQLNDTADHLPPQ